VYHRFLQFTVALAFAMLSPCALAAVVLGDSSNPVPPGGAVNVDLAFTGVADAPTVVILQFTFDPVLCTPIGATLPTDAPGKAIDWNVVDTTLYVVAYSLDTPFTLSDVLRLQIRVASGAPLGEIVVPRSGGSASNEALEDLVLTLDGFSINVQARTGTHDSDTDSNWAISLSELLRLIQLYNSPGFHCEAGTEDGFAVGPGDTTCAPHDSDYVPQNWDISLSELLRLIQIYNVTFGSYHADVSGEDGFNPGPF